MRYATIVTGLITLMLTNLAQAGLAVNGRLATIEHLPEKSIEGKLELGTGNDDITTYSARYNFKSTEGLLFTATLGAVDAVSESSAMLGIGAQFVLDGVLAKNHLAAFFNFSRITEDKAANWINIGAIVSSETAFGANKNLQWYANIYINRITGGGSDTELGLGAGVVMPISSGELYTGVDLIDDLIFGFGYRYFLK